MVIKNVSTPRDNPCINPLIFVAAGNVSEAAVDDSVTRILSALHAVGVMDEPWGTYNFTKLQGQYSVLL